VTGGSASHAADDLIQLLEKTISDMSQLGSTRGDEQRVTVSLHQIQASDSLPLDSQGRLPPSKAKDANSLP